MNQSLEHSCPQRQIHLSHAAARSTTTPAHRSKQKLASWVEACRLRTLPLAAAGVILAAGIAAYYHSFQWTIFIPMLLMALSLQILSNFADELGDLLSGVDDEERLGPIRALQRGDISKKEMIAGVVISSVASNFFAVLCLLASFKTPSAPGFIGFFILELLCIAAAILYTIGPRPYGYIGLGDLISFIFFGPVAVVGGAYLYIHSLPASLWLAGFALGCPVVCVINLNNMRDAQTDKAKGKLSVANILGDPAMRLYHACILIMAMLSFIVYRYLLAEAAQGNHWYYYFFVLAYIPWIISLIKIFKLKDPRAFDMLMKPTAGASVLVSLLLSISLASSLWLN